MKTERIKVPVTEYVIEYECIFCGKKSLSPKDIEECESLCRQKDCKHYCTKVVIEEFPGRSYDVDDHEPGYLYLLEKCSNCNKVISDKKMDLCCSRKFFREVYELADDFVICGCKENNEEETS